MPRADDGATLAGMGDAHLAAHPHRGGGAQGGAPPDGPRTARRSTRPPCRRRWVADGQTTVRAAGEGNAEEWLGAAPSVARTRRNGPAAVQRPAHLSQGRSGALHRLPGAGDRSDRAARRARLPMAFSQGHHPLPRLAFGPALPLGAESEASLRHRPDGPGRGRGRARTPGCSCPRACAARRRRDIPVRARSTDESVAGFR